MPSDLAWIGVDWGSSNLRCWGFDDTGEILFERRSGAGALALEASQFEPVLLDLLAGQRADIVICGMAGRRGGWREAPYLDVPTSLEALGAAGIRAPSRAGLEVVILPGLCRREKGSEDVMRGEETQLLGLATGLDADDLVCLPGTHCKWVRLKGSEVRSFRTAMTGELFTLMTRHSALRQAVSADDAMDQEGFQAGLAAGADAPERLSSEFFTVRAASLLSGRPPQWCTGYLSGLLIGADVAVNATPGTTVCLVGGGGLGELYGKALSRLGVITRMVDAREMTIAGLRKARQQMEGLPQ